MNEFVLSGLVKRRAENRTRPLVKELKQGHCRALTLY
jgi:hypothetical protein